MAMTVPSASTRAPRGTKILTQAFFAAADDIPDAQRASVVKAALTAIRDQIKNNRDRVKAAKAAAKAKLVRAPEKLAAAKRGRAAAVKGARALPAKRKPARKAQAANAPAE